MATGPRSALLRDVETLYRLGAAGGLTDGQLLRRFLAGGGEAAELAFAGLVRRHGPLVLGVCRRMLPVADAEDAFQAVFLVLHRRARRLAGSEDITGWLHNVAVRTARESRRRHARRRARETRAMANRPTESRPDEPTRDLLDALDAELERLPARYRDPILQCDLQGLGRVEAARRLGIPPGTLSSRLARGRRLLRDRLIRLGITPALGALAALNSTAEAALPGALERSAIATASRLAHGAGVIPAAVADLAEGVLKAMLLTRLKVGLSALMLVGLAAGFAAGLAMTQDPMPEPKPDPKSAARPVADRTDGPPFVEVLVRARDTGKPLADASVQAYIDYQFLDLKTGPDGRARIARTGRTFNDSLDIDVWAEGYVQQRFHFSQLDARQPKIPGRFEVNLWPGEETLGGRVVDEQGRPIAGVKVAVWGWLGEKKDPHELAFKVDARTDERGDWRCRCFRKMTFAYLYISHPDYLSDDESHGRAHGGPSGRTQPDGQLFAKLRDFSDVQVLTRGVEVSGQVLDNRIQPVAGAEVGWFDADRQGSTFHHDLPTTTTDAKGLFRFPHTRPGRLIVQVKAKGYAPALKSAEAKAGMDPVTIELKPPRSLAGRLLDTGGRPIAGATVSIGAWRGSHALGVFLKTDAQGRFLWPDAPDDPFMLQASQVGYSSINDRRTTPDEGPITLTLQKTLVITGWLRSNGPDRQVQRIRADIDVGIQDPKTGAIDWNQVPRAMAHDGYMQVTLDAEKKSNYRLRIQARGFEPFESRTFRSDEGQVEFDVTLVKSATPPVPVLNGTVRRPDGKPLAGAQVALTYWPSGPDPLPHVQIEDGKLLQHGPEAATKTDADGRFSLAREPDPAGSNFALVVVHPEFFAQVLRSAFEVNPTITAQPWGRVEGIIRIGGRPAAGAEVCYFADRLGNPGVLDVHDRGRAVADAEGRFVLDRVIPGDVRVARGFGSGADLKAWSNGSLILVRAGETARVEVGGQGRPVIARIAPPEGFDPLEDYTIHSEFEIESDRPSIPYPDPVTGPRDANWAQRWWTSEEGRDYRRQWFRLGQAKLQLDGSIRADDVPPGTYRLKLTFSADPIYGPDANASLVTYTTRTFTIPEGDPTDGPIDLGTLHPKPKERPGLIPPVPPILKAP